MYRDLGFLRVWGGQSHPDGPDELRGVDYAYLIYPHKPIVAYLPQTGRLLNEYCVEFPDETRPYGSPRLPDSDDVLAKWMALNGDERRVIAEANLHLPGRQFDPRQIERDLWRLGRWERERLARALRAERRHPARGRAGRRLSARMDPKHRSRAADRGPRAGAGPRLPPRHRLRRGGAGQADHRRRLDLDRDDAVQLRPPHARGQGQGGDPRGGRHPDGVQHHRDLRRHHDGDLGHEDVAGLARGRRRLDRARRPRPPLRRDRRPRRLRQDDPRRRDGARAARRARRPALRRLDPARPLQGRRRLDPRGLRGRRQARRRQDERRGARRAREGRLARHRRLRRPVHREHDGDGLRGPRPEPDGLRDGPRRLRGQEPGRQGVRRADHGRPRPRPAPARHHHPRGARERDRGDRHQRRLHQRRPAPARARPRGRRGARHRRLRPHRRGHAHDVRPQARRPLRRQGPVRRGRRRHRRQAPARGGHPPRGRPDRHRPHDRRARPRGGGDGGPGGRPPGRRPGQEDRRSRHPARQPRARRLAS